MSRKSPKIEALLADIADDGIHARHYLGYFACFNRQLYYEAHDVLEEMWLPLRGTPRRVFIRGSFRLRAGLSICRRRRLLVENSTALPPVAGFFTLALANFEGYPAHHGGIDLDAVRALCREQRRLILDSGETVNPWSPDRARSLRGRMRRGLGYEASCALVPYTLRFYAIFMYGRSMRETPSEDRPRERLVKLGSEALKTSELIAILLRTGTAGRPVLELAEFLLQHFGSLEALSRAPVGELIRVKGVGQAKAIELKAAFALGARLNRTEAEARAIETADDIARLLGDEMRLLDYESVRIVCLNTKHMVLAVEEVTRGTLNESLFHPRELFAPR